VAVLSSARCWIALEDMDLLIITSKNVGFGVLSIGQPLHKAKFIRTIWTIPKTVASQRISGSHMTTPPFE
jgi:hypothetical protein